MKDQNLLVYKIIGTVQLLSLLYQRKGASEKVYVRPDVVKLSPVKDKVTEWFKSRGISQRPVRPRIQFSLIT